MFHDKPPSPLDSLDKYLSLNKDEMTIHLVHSLTAPEPIESNECMAGAIRIARIIRWLVSQDERDKIFNMIMATVSHSASCKKRLCCLLCIMFRKVRLHMANSCRHPCYVLCFYSPILKMHVKTCTSGNCGMAYCPKLREMLICKIRESKAKDSMRDELENEKKKMRDELENEKKKMREELENERKKIREEVEKEEKKKMQQEIEKEKKEMWEQIEKMKKKQEQQERKLDDIVKNISIDIEESPKKRRFSSIEEEVNDTPPVKKVDNNVSKNVNK